MSDIVTAGNMKFFGVKEQGVGPEKEVKVVPLDEILERLGLKNETDTEPVQPSKS